MKSKIDANTRFQQRYPGGSIERQPVHSVYGGAQLFKAGGHLRLGSLARFMPYPVIAGFLAATGYLLVMGGLGTASRSRLQGKCQARARKR